MNTICRLQFPVLVSLVLFFTCPIFAKGLQWSPPDPSELAETTPKVDPEAGAEILYRETTLDYEEGVEKYYFRAKIFRPRGIDQLTRVDILLQKKDRLVDFRARTIKPDGSYVEVKEKDIFDCEVLKSNKGKVNAKSFALPQLEVGAIVEYSYTIKPYYVYGYSADLFFQHQLPTRAVKYRVALGQAHLFRGLGTRLLNFNCEAPPKKYDKDGYLSFEFFNLPAVHEEPYQPPEINTQICTVVYYSTEKRTTPTEYWNEWSKILNDDKFELETWPSKLIRTQAAQLTTPGKSPEQTLRSFYDFCRTQIVNLDRDTAEVTVKEREKMAESEKAHQTLKSRAGTSDEINMLFAALCRAAKFDTRLVACADRSRMLFVPDALFANALSKIVVAVQVAGQWKLFDPGATYLPIGTLAWQNTDTLALFSDKKGRSELVTLKGRPAESSVHFRRGQLQLDAEGTLEGDVIESFTGLLEAETKDALEGKSMEKVDVFVREKIQAHQKLAEVTSIVVTNADNPVEPLRISYHLRIPGYADRTGSRLFLQPAVFYKGRSPIFSEKKRYNDIQFNYRHVTQDDIRITLPEGFELEEPSAPTPLDFGRLGAYEAKISLNRKTGEIFFRRNFRLDHLTFPVADYAAIKDAFDLIHERDNHTLTLKKTDLAETKVPGIVSAK